MYVEEWRPHCLAGEVEIFGLAAHCDKTSTRMHHYFIRRDLQNFCQRGFMFTEFHRTQRGAGIIRFVQVDNNKKSLQALLAIETA